MRVQCPREHRRVQYRNRMRACQVADFERQQVRAARDHLRCAHARLVVADGDREVGRVHDHEVGLGNRPDAVALRHLALACALLALDQRVAFRFLVFLPDLLVRHLEARLVEEFLQRNIDHGNQQNDQQQQTHSGYQPLVHVCYRRDRGLHDQRHHGLRRGCQINRADQAQHDHDHQHLGHLGQFLPGKKPAKTRERVQTAEVRHQRLQAVDPAAYGNRTQDHRGHHDDGEYRAPDQAQRGHFLQAVQHGLRVDDGNRIE